jgi:hypothetical protein
MFTFILSFLLGVALIILTLKKKAKGLPKKFLLLTGFSLAGFFIFVLLHNLTYGLLIYIFGQDFWERTGIGDEPVFFILAVIVCPIGLLVGLIGTIVLFIKKKRDEKKLQKETDSNY